MSSGKRSKEDAAGFGAAPGGPQHPVAPIPTVPTVAQQPIPAKAKDKDAELILAGFGRVAGGPHSDVVTWDLSPAASGALAGGPPPPPALLAVVDAAAAAAALAAPPPTGELVGGPPEPISAYTGNNKWKLAARRVLEAAGERVGAAPGGPPPPRLVFGVALDEVLEREGGRIPYVIAAAIDYLARDEYASCKLTGIFRLSGATSDLDALVDAYNWGRTDVNIDAITNDPIAVAALIKLFLRELPEPLITYDLNPLFLKLAGSPTVDSVADALLRLPASSRELLCQLLIFLNIVSVFADVNKMASHNLAIVIGPNILRLPDVSPLQEIAMSGRISAISQFMIEYAYDLTAAAGVPDADRIYYDQLYPPYDYDDPDPDLASSPACAVDDDAAPSASLLSASAALAGLSSDDDDPAPAADAPPPLPPPASPTLLASNAAADRKIRRRSTRAPSVGGARPPMPAKPPPMPARPTLAPIPAHDQPDASPPSTLDGHAMDEEPASAASGAVAAAAATGVVAAVAVTTATASAPESAPSPPPTTLPEQPDAPDADAADAATAPPTTQPPPSAPASTATPTPPPPPLSPPPPEALRPFVDAHEASLISAA